MVLVERFGLVEILLLLVFVTPRWPDDWRIIEWSWWLSPASIGCLWGVLCLPQRSAKGNSSGLRVACGSLSCVDCAAPGCGLGVWCLLAREPPSERIATTWTSLLASKWTSEEKLIMSSLSPWYSLIFIDWSLATVVYHFFHSLALLCVFILCSACS